MKLIKSSYLLVNLEPNKSKWSFTVPSGLIKVQDSRTEKLKVYVKKCVYRNDFPTVSTGKDEIKINGNTVQVRHGSPDAYLLAKELESKTPGLKWVFDTYDGRLYLENAGVVPYTIEGYKMRSIIGITELSLSPGQRTAAQNPVDLAPPEVLNFKSNFLTSNMEIREEGVKISDILVCIGNDVVPYQTKLYTDNQGQYGHFLLRPSIDLIEISLEDNENNLITTPNPIVMILAIEIFKDDEREILNAVNEQLDLAKLKFIAKK